VQGVANRDFQTRIKWICESFYQLLLGEMVVSRNSTKGISQMGFTYFLLIVAISLGGMLLVLRKVNSKSYLAGEKGDGIDSQERQTASQRNKIKHPGEEAYVNWYMAKFESAQG
jgi:hypothetical protein